MKLLLIICFLPLVSFAATSKHIQVEGKIVSLNDKEIVIESNGKKETYDRSKVTNLTSTKPNTKTKFDLNTEGL